MFIRMSGNITECARCGTCCLKGGPILHHEDKKILLAGYAGHQHLVTIRRGELAHNPVTNRLEQIQRELIKVIGKDDSWSCYFYDEEKASCSIYEHRFLECRLLKCWDTSGILSVIGKDTIVRADIINPNDPVMDLIETHERECPVHEIQDLISGMSSEKEKPGILSRLTEFVRKDLSIRTHAISELGLKAEFELFIFGRPLVKLLEDHGLTDRQTEQG